MFGKPLQCSICYKTSPRDHGLTFKHKVDTDCGNGWFCTSRQRIHVCNDCLKVIRDMAQEHIGRTQYHITLDGDAFAKVLSRHMKGVDVR